MNYHNKRVVQISMDIIVDQTYDGVDLAEDAADELAKLGFEVVGAGFSDDVTDYYEEYCPKLLDM